MSIRRIHEVGIIEYGKHRCESCNGGLQARKLEILYQASPKGGTSAYLAADVLYCKRCDKGYVFRTFADLVDSQNRKWYVREAPVRADRAVPTQQPKPEAIPAARESGKPQPKVNHDAVKTIDFIHLLLQDHESRCPTCRVELGTQYVRLRISKDERHDYVPCKVLVCSDCRRWMLRKHHYNTLAINNKPYTIQVASKGSKGKSGRAQGSDDRPNKNNQVPPRNRQFNKYGVFLPSPTGKRGYFDE